MERSDCLMAGLRWLAPMVLAMPVEFLSDQEAAAFGRYGGPVPQADLERFFFLDDGDRLLVAGLRGDHNRLGFSLPAGYGALYRQVPGGSAGGGAGRGHRPQAVIRMCRGVT